MYKSREKFTPTTYNDSGFAIAFLLQLTAVVAWVCFAAAAGKYQVMDDASASGKAVALLQGKFTPATTAEDKAQYAAIIAFVSLGLAVAWGGVWMFLLQQYPREIVQISMLFLPVMFCVMGLINLVTANTFGAILCFLGAALFGAYAYFVWDKAEFTGLLFKATSAIYTRSGGIFGVAALVMLAQVVWLAVWLLAVMPFFISGGGGLGFVALLLSLFWGFQVVTNVLYVACGGVVARWYFNKNVDVAVQEATTHASTYYFGSICFGSLLVAIIQTLRALCDMAEQQAKDADNPVVMMLACVASAILSCLESLAQMFNTFAFSFISIYGMPFMEAGEAVMNLASVAPLDNYCIVGTVCFFGNCAGALVVCAFTALLAWRCAVGTSFVIGGAIMGFFMGFAVMSVLARVMEAGTTTLFVAYLEEPAGAKLKDLEPELDQKFEEAASEGRALLKK